MFALASWEDFGRVQNRQQRMREHANETITATLVVALLIVDSDGHASQTDSEEDQL